MLQTEILQTSLYKTSWCLGFFNCDVKAKPQESEQQYRRVNIKLTQLQKTSPAFGRVNGRSLSAF